PLVTGVQTCALPISAVPGRRAARGAQGVRRLLTELQGGGRGLLSVQHPAEEGVRERDLRDLLRAGRLGHARQRVRQRLRLWAGLDRKSVVWGDRGEE